MPSAAPPVDLREVFAAPWEGEGTVWRPWWLRWMPAPSRFHFRSEIADVRGDSWEVIDTTTFPDGTVQRRRMRSRLEEPGRLVLTADDMPKGAVVHARGDGFDFEPYVIRTPVLGPLRLPLRYRDSVELPGDGTMVDTMELRLMGVRVGRVTIELRRRDR